MDNTSRVPSHPVQVRLPHDIYAQVESLAHKERIGVASVLRRWAIERLATLNDSAAWLDAQQKGKN